MTYHLGKVSVYIVLALRVNVAFHGSSFTDHPFVKYTLYGNYFLTFCFFCMTVIGDSTQVTGTLTFPTDTDDDSMHYCLLNDLPLWGLLTFFTCDLLISALCVTVFNYPLKMMIKNQTSADRKIVSLIRKYAILSTTAICTTLVFIILVVRFKLGWFGLLDNCINTVCLLGMSSWYQKYWDRMAACCCCNRDEDMRRLEQSQKSMDPTVTTITTNMSSSATKTDKKHPSEYKHSIAMSTSVVSSLDVDSDHKSVSVDEEPFTE